MRSVQANAAAWTALVSEDRSEFKYDSVSRITGEKPGYPGRVSFPIRVLVEVHRMAGMEQRALLGAEFHPMPAQLLSFEITVSAERVTANGERVQSPLSARLAPGLPREFALGVKTGLNHQETRLPSGRLRVDRGGFEPYESSSRAFEFAARVLAAIVSMRADQHAVDKRALEGAMRRASGRTSD